jgi:hypothetical protein
MGWKTMSKVFLRLLFLLVASLFLILPGTPTTHAQTFHWNWKAATELSALDTLKNIDLAHREKLEISSAIGKDSRVALVRLRRPGPPNVIAQGLGQEVCGATGNCPLWVLEKSGGHYKLILNGFGQTFTVQSTRTNGFSDIVISMQGSATSSDLMLYKYKNGQYHRTACFDAEWAVREGDESRNLKEPRVTPEACAD